jgi:hypothetical protein
VKKTNFLSAIGIMVFCSIAIVNSSRAQMSAFSPALLLLLSETACNSVGKVNQGACDTSGDTAAGGGGYGGSTTVNLFEFYALRDEIITGETYLSFKEAQAEDGEPLFFEEKAIDTYLLGGSEPYPPTVTLSDSFVEDEIVNSGKYYRTDVAMGVFRGCVYGMLTDWMMDMGFGVTAYSQYFDYDSYARFTAGKEMQYVHYFSLMAPNNRFIVTEYLNGTVSSNDAFEVGFSAGTSHDYMCETMREYVTEKACEDFTAAGFANDICHGDASGDTGL